MRNIKRHDPDLNREFREEQAFQACAIPDYAIMAVNMINCVCFWSSFLKKVAVVLRHGVYITK
jgi:hypothetical protein